ncbi:hypothetical protein BIBO2_3123 [Brucella sp. BO2]|nr:hypothetical protein BIBO2_3123 [Brucella sp. BO2]
MQRLQKGGGPTVFGMNELVAHQMSDKLSDPLEVAEIILFQRGELKKHSPPPI